MFYRKKKLAPHRTALLEELGFEWIRPHRSQSQSPKKDAVASPLIKSTDADGTAQDMPPSYVSEQTERVLESQQTMGGATSEESQEVNATTTMRSPNFDSHRATAFV